MYMDTVVFAGIAVVLLVIVFAICVGIFVIRDQRIHGNGHREKAQSKNGVP